MTETQTIKDCQELILALLNRQEPNNEGIIEYKSSWRELIKLCSLVLCEQTGTEDYSSAKKIVTSAMNQLRKFEYISFEEMYGIYNGDCNIGRPLTNKEIARYMQIRHKLYRQYTIDGRPCTNYFEVSQAGNGKEMLQRLGNEVRKEFGNDKNEWFTVRKFLNIVTTPDIIALGTKSLESVGAERPL